MKAILTKLIESKVANVFTRIQYDNQSTEKINNSIRKAVLDLPHYLKMNIRKDVDFEGFGYEDTVENVARYLAVELIKDKMDLN